MTNCPNCGARVAPNVLGNIICDYCGGFIGVAGNLIENINPATEIKINIPDYALERIFTRNEVCNLIEYEAIRDEKEELHRQRTVNDGIIGNNTFRSFK